MRDLLVATAVLLAGCAAGGRPPASREAAPLFRTRAAAAPAVPPAAELPPPAGARDGVSIEVRFETSKGVTVMAPRIVAFLGGRSRAQVLTQTSYIADFDVERTPDAAVMDPVVKIADEGITLEMTARKGTRGTALAWSLRTARLKKPLDVESFDDLHGHRLTLQLPTFERAEAEGVRGMEDGVWGLLARLPGGGGETVSVLARVTPERIEFSSKEEDARDIALVDPGQPAPAEREIEGDSLPARAAKAALPEAPAGTLDLHALTLTSDLPPGSVVEAEAAALATALPLEPGSLQWVTSLVPGARAASLLDEAFLAEYAVAASPDTADPVTRTRVSGLTAEVGKYGDLSLSWTTTAWTRSPATVAGRPFSLDVPRSSTSTARVVPGASPRLVVLAPLDGGRVAAVLVRFRTE